VAFTFASGTSLVVCTALVALWIRGYWVDDSFMGTITYSSVTEILVDASRGRIEIHTCEWEPNPQRRLEVDLDHLKMHPSDLTIRRDSDLDDRIYWNRWGVIVIRGHEMSFPTTWKVLFPIWPGVVIAAGLPSIWIKTRRQKPVAAGCCTCGYNLTGNMSGICPECGAERIDRPRHAPRVPRSSRRESSG